MEMYSITHPIRWAALLAGCALLSASVTAAPEDLGERGYVYLKTTEQSFREAVRSFLKKEGMNPDEIQIELRPLADKALGISGRWRALAEVSVDMKHGKLIKQLVFDRDYWLQPDTSSRVLDQRWTKVMWHEIHHLKHLPLNLERARDLAGHFPPRKAIAKYAWERKWVTLLEPLEEYAAERECLERYQRAYGPVPAALLKDSQSDMRKHAARYDALMKDVLAFARDPGRIRQTFPPQLPVDKDGNI